MNECGLCFKDWDEKDPFEFDPNSDILCWALFRDSRHFTFGLSGGFETENEINFTNPDLKYVCNSCMKTIPFHKYYTIECDSCHQKYQDCFGDDQGVFCASTLFKDKLMCHWGSSFDGAIFNWKENTKFEDFDLELDSNICDHCIQILLDQNKIYRKRYEFSYY